MTDGSLVNSAYCGRNGTIIWKRIDPVQQNTTKSKVNKTFLVRLFVYLLSSFPLSELTWTIESSENPSGSTSVASSFSLCSSSNLSDRTDEWPQLK